MRAGRGKHARLGAWLGVLALAVQAFLPVHLVFDIVEAGSVAGLHHDRPEVHRHVHAGAPAGRPGNGHDDHCPISLDQLQATSAFTLPAIVMAPPCPELDRRAATPVLASRELASASPASYASRAPPLLAIG